VDEISNFPFSGARKIRRKKICVQSSCGSAQKSLSTVILPPPPLHLLDLPYNILESLLQYLDVSSLQALSTTCSFFSNLVSGGAIVSLDFPWSPSFTAELAETATIEKKPVYRLTSLKKDDTNVPDDEDVFVEYFVSTQLALLSLKKLRELYLVPTHLQLQDGSTSTPAERARIASFVQFDKILLRQISSLGGLFNITRLEVLLDRHCYLDQFMQYLPNLLHLGMTIHFVKSFSVHSLSFESYLNRLESIVIASRAPNLSVKVLSERERFRKTKKIFSNDVVEKLSVSVPCNFNAHLVMEKLTEVVINYPNPGACTYNRANPTDRILHRAGLCCVKLSSVHQRCPNLKTFAGIDISGVSMQQSFLKWSNRIKKSFYDDYVTKGGSMDAKAWSKVRGGRWFSKREALTTFIGHARKDYL